MAEPFRRAVQADPAPSKVEPLPKAEPEEAKEGTPTTPRTETKESVDSLLVSYQTDQGRPFTATYFDVQNVWDKEPTLKRDLLEIEGYLRSQVESKKLANDTKAADNFIKELERKAGIVRYETPATRIEKLLAYIDFRKVVDS